MGTTTVPNIHYNKDMRTAHSQILQKFDNFIFMSTLHHEDMLLDIFAEVQEAFPYLDEENQIEIANNRFQDLCQ